MFVNVCFADRKYFAQLQNTFRASLNETYSAYYDATDTEKGQPRLQYVGVCVVVVVFIISDGKFARACVCTFVSHLMMGVGGRVMLEGGSQIRRRNLLLLTSSRAAAIESMTPTT